MDEFRRVPDDELSRLLRMSVRVAEALSAAGLPTTVGREPRQPLRPGAEVEVDPGDDAAGGVWVHWHGADEVEDRAGADVLAGSIDSPSIAYLGAVSGAMQLALTTILSAAGFETECSDDDMRPFAVRVTQVPDDQNVRAHKITGGG